jgi:integrase
VTYVKIKGFKIFKDRHGKSRCYHRATGLVIDLEKCPIGSVDFIAECQRVATLQSVAANPKPGTLGLLIKAYRSHASYQELAQRTRKDYMRCFEWLKPLADTPLVRFTPPLVVKISDKAATQIGRRWANYVKTVLSLLFVWGVERGYLAANPAFKIKGVKKPKGTPQANRPWEDFEREAVLAEIPPHMRLPITVMMYCGLDPGDTLKLPRTAIRDGALNTNRNKTDVAVWLPLPASVTNTIQEAPSHNAITICANTYGKPWTVSGFSASWRTFRKRLEEAGRVNKGLTLKGLRHTVATILKEMGYDDRTIADYLGQKTIAMAQHYSSRANTARKLTPVVSSFVEEVNRRRTKVVKPQ